MIGLRDFLQCVEANAKRVRGYQLSHDGSDGKSDCIGLVIGAVKLAGEKWPGTHGSNWAARYAMDNLAYIPNVDELFLGEIVYRAYEPWEDKYDLPSRYDDSGDALDYYHVGVVTSVRPLIITHCTGVAGGIKRDCLLGKWRYGAKLKYVDYASFDGGEMEEGVGTMNSYEADQYSYMATVHSDNGKPVNFRSGPGKHYPLIDQLTVGSAVTVIGTVEDAPLWLAVQYRGRIGYMMSVYLMPADEYDTETDEAEDGPDIDTAEPEEQPADAGNMTDAPGETEPIAATKPPMGEVMVSIPRETLETWADVLEEMARDMREILKRER